jgi:DNA-binding CsgD family transcriptional regulator
VTATPRPRGRITQAEYAVLKLVADGHTNAAIAQQLDTTVPGVRGRLAHIKHKLRARNRAHAVHIGHKIGVLK